MSVLPLLALATTGIHYPQWSLAQVKHEQTRWPSLEAANREAIMTIPVVIVAFLPTKGDSSLDDSITGMRTSLSGIKDRIETQAIVARWMLEEGSKFHGYKNPSAKPSLTYPVKSVYLVYSDIPKRPTGPENKTNWPDYGRIIEQIGGKNWVNESGVKEFWIYHWHNEGSNIIESNMASPNSPDVSNSWLENDLPIYEKTYVVYGLNFGREASMHVHNVGHQVERALSYANQRQDGNTELFMQEFSGYDKDGKMAGGRVGNCHFPPNATADYDYFNAAPRQSDIENWAPYRDNPKKPVSNLTWESIPYKFPKGLTRKHAWVGADAHWYIYWFQNIPGRDQQIPHPRGHLTNWWRFIGDWDASMISKLGLWTPSTG